MKYLMDSFQTDANSKEYRENFDTIFGEVTVLHDSHRISVRVRKLPLGKDGLHGYDIDVRNFSGKWERLESNLVRAVARARISLLFSENNLGEVPEFQ